MSAARALLQGRGGLLRIGRNALALGALQIGGSLATMALAAVLTRHVGLPGLNRVLLALSVEAITAAIADLGLNTYAMRELARDATRADDLMGLVLPVKVLLSLLAALLVGSGAQALFGVQRGAIIALTVLALPFGAVTMAVIVWLKARQEMHISSAAQLVQRWLFAGGGIVLLLLGSNEHTVVVCWPLANLCSAAWALWYLWRQGVRPRWRLAWGETLRLLREAVPFAVTGIAAMIYRRMDLLLLSLFRPDAEAGAYGAAYRLFELLALPPAALLDALFPELARCAAREASRAALLSVYHLGRRVALALAVMLTSATLLLAPLAVRLAYGVRTLASDSATLLRLLSVALPCSALYLIAGHLLIVLNRQREVSRAMLLAAGASTALNLALTPFWGHWGAVLTALFCEGLLLILLGRAASRALHELQGASSGAH